MHVDEKCYTYGATDIFLSENDSIFFGACGLKILLVAPHLYSCFRFYFIILCHKSVERVYCFTFIDDLKFLWIC